VKRLVLALVLVGCNSPQAPLGRLARTESPRTSREARALGCDLYGAHDGAGSARTASIAEGVTVIVEARGLEADEAGPLTLRVALGSIGPDGEPLYDDQPPIFDRGYFVPEADRWVDLSFPQISIWPAPGAGQTERPVLYDARFVAELAADGHDLYASGALFFGYLADPRAFDLDARVDDGVASTCDDRGCNARSVCVRADIDPLDPRVP
jgi:hypothetical protein